MYSRWKPTNNISEINFEEDSPRPNLGLGFGGVRGISGKFNLISFWQNLIIEDRRLKFEYTVYRDPLIKFEMKNL